MKDAGRLLWVSMAAGFPVRDTSKGQEPGTGVASYRHLAIQGKTMTWTRHKMATGRDCGDIEGGRKEMTEGNQILFDTWAEAWQQGCLLGNGHMGQVIYGRPGEEIVELSHVAFFSGSGNADPYPVQGPEAFAGARWAALAGDFGEVYRQTGKMMGKRGNYGTNLPVGKLHIRIGDGNVDTLREYRRFLDLDRGLAGCMYGTGDIGGKKPGDVGSAVNMAGNFAGAGDARPCGRHHRREAFTSHPDQVFVYYLEETDGMRESGNLSLEVSFDGGRNPFWTWEEDGLLCFRTRALETVHSDGTEGAWLCGAVKVCAEENRAVLYLAMEVWTEEKNAREKAWQQVKARVCQGMAGYTRLRERHVQDMAAFMGRQRLWLGKKEKGEEAKTAGTLLEEVRSGGDNRHLTELMYQYGRYLLLSSSRQDSPLPAHLQGVWNDDVACQIGWTCDMHLDINTQMNYWISEPGNLGECHEPLFRWMEQCLVPNGRLTARNCYGYDGWVGELVSNAWGYAAPYWNESLSPCPTGGIWQASDYLEHYRYGQDKDFLERRALPVIGEAVGFFLDYLCEDGKGHLVGGPSISPENAFLVEGEKYFASMGCTYEMGMIRELFLEYVEICRELGIGECQGAVRGSEGLEDTGRAQRQETGDGGIKPEAGADMASGQEQGRKPEPDGGLNPGGEPEPGGGLKPGGKLEQCGRREPGMDWADLLARVGKALPRLLPYRILSDGTLAEWQHDYPAADLQHRHTSHLLGLFPYSQITLEGTPGLARAAAASIQAKLTPYENWEDTGWARSLLTLYSARLREPDQVYRHLRSMQTQLTGDNLLVMHPPTRGAGSFMEVYELDGNTGFSMAVMELLIQSHGDCIRLLPALPEAWPEGRLEGAVLRGGITLDLYWEQGRPVKTVLQSVRGREVTLCYGSQVRKCFAPANGQSVVMWE